MSLFKPSVLKNFLRELEAAPNKNLSQNFLIDGNILNKILAAAEVTPGDFVVEIGPGPGVLTEALLKKGAYVLAIEKDKKFAQSLKRFESPHFECLAIDFLAVDLQDELKNRLKSSQKAKVISNIPYHLTGIILQRLLPLHETISQLTLMMQKEVTERCLSEPKEKNYSSFTLFTRFYSHPKFLFKVEPSCFYPKPSVSSAVMQLTLRKPTHEVDTRFLFAITRTAFKQRRKMLRASLKSLFSAQEVEAILQSLGLKPTARPEELTLEMFLCFAQRLKDKKENCPYT